MTTPSTAESHGISWVGKTLMIGFSLLFAVEIIMPWVLVILGFPGNTSVGDANTKAVLTNLVIAIMSYIVGRNEGSRQQEQTLSKMADTAKTVASTAAAAVTSGTIADGTVKLKEGEEVNIEAVPDPENK